MVGIDHNDIDLSQKVTPVIFARTQELADEIRSVMRRGEEVRRVLGVRLNALDPAASASIRKHVEELLGVKF